MSRDRLGVSGVCWFSFLIFVTTIANSSPHGNNPNETAANEFMKRYEAELPLIEHDRAVVGWAYVTHLTDDNEKAYIAKKGSTAAYYKSAALNASSYDWENFSDTDLRRKIKLVSYPETAVLTEEKYAELSTIIANMTATYSTAKICPYETHQEENCNATWSLDPEITEIMATSRDYGKLLYVWQNWHEASARTMRKNYVRYVELNNEAAKLNGFADRSEDWLSVYESEAFAAEIEQLWQLVKPLYLQLHAYVRKKLVDKYGTKVRHDGLVPAHLLGNMWALSWEKLMDLVKPFPNKPSADATPEMIKQNYTAVQLFHTANNFYKSVGLLDVPASFWNLSMLEKPEDREVVCHPSAWDFFDGQDCRIRMCTVPNFADFVTAHHELGHIQYYMQFKDLSVVYRDGANPGFHEAVGDTMALFASSPFYLQKINLISQYSDDEESNINFLMGVALDKITFLPFSYVVDLWRWKVFRGEITPENYNEKWWELRKEYQGIEPAVPRTEQDFDPGAKYHIPADTEYLRYFVSCIVQFQFYKALCIEADQYDPDDPAKPLCKCDVYRNKEVGLLFSKMLKMGRSRPWPEAMAAITKGETNAMDASAILEYFKPLMEFLETENAKTQEFIGWRSGPP